VPWRALVVGTVLLPLLTHFGHLSYIIAQSAVWTAETLLRGPVVLLCLLAVWSLLWRRVSPRLARYLALTRAELILVYLMVTVGTALAGECWALFVVPALGGTAAYQAATGHPEWATWLGDTPKWFFVQDPAVVFALHYGQSSLYRAENLRALAVPVAAWAALMLALAVFTQCLMQVVQRQWLHRERLSFPLIYLPLTLVDTEGPQAWWRSRLFWAGMATAGILETINGLNYLFPTVPYIPLKVTQFAAATDKPWSGLGPVWVAFYPWVIAVGFLVPLEVTFSLWFFFWVARAQDLTVTMMGMRNGGGYSPGQPPYHLHQMTGAFLMMGLTLLWRARRDIVGMGRRAASGANRCTLFWLVASGGAVLLWGSIARIPLPLSGAFLAIYGLFSVVLGRLAAESGGLASPAPISIHETVALTQNLHAFSQRALVTFGWWQNLGVQVTDDLMPHQITGARLAEEVGAERRLHLMLAAGAVVGVVTGLWSLLHLYFHYGIMSAEVRGWPARSAPQGNFRFIDNWVNGHVELPPGQLIAFLVGGAVTMLLMWLRQTYASWPLHPIGYAVASNWGMQEVWCPFLISWLIKATTMRFGGIRLYRTMLPFFLGVILGDFLVPLGWAAIGVWTGQQMYLAYPH
jgi:Family of unknown function (DUF6785)/Domain of unknown function (DUF6784)